MNRQSIARAAAALLFLAAAYCLGAERLLLAVLTGSMAVLILGLTAPQARAAPAGEPPLPPLPPGEDPERLDIGDIDDAALLLGPDRRVIAANEAARELMGEVVGEDVRLALRHPGALEAVANARGADGSVVRELEGFAGSARTHRLRLTPVSGDRLLLILTDISPVRAAERMRADFVANASHELRTPLATVSGFIETLQGAAADDEAARARFLTLMGDEAARMTRLIDDLLSLSRIELDKNVRPRTALDLPALAAEFSETVSLQTEGEGRPLFIESEPDLPRVLADRDQILQVFNNLLSNALKYGAPGTPIRLRLSRRADRVHIVMTDEGEGIESEHLPRLTERFYRVDAGRSRRLGGTGLGLAIVKHIVERHRGRLSIRSFPGQGTEIGFALPVAPENPFSAAAGPS